MLHPKSQGHPPFWFWRRKFLKGFYHIWVLYMGAIYGGHLGHVTRTIWTNFRSRVLRSLHMKFELNWRKWPSGSRGEDVWKCSLTDDGRTDTGVIGILLAHPWAFGSGVLKMLEQFCSLFWLLLEGPVNTVRSHQEQTGLSIPCEILFYKLEVF